MTDSKATAGNGNAAFAFLDQTHREIDAKLLRLKALADAGAPPPPGSLAYRSWVVSAGGNVSELGARTSATRESAVRSSSRSRPILRASR